MDELLEGIELNVYNMGTKQCSAATYINYGQVGNPWKDYLICSLDKLILGH